MAARTRELLAQAPEAYVIFNNHPQGQAPANAVELTGLLTGRRLPLPPCLLAAFPRLKEVVSGGEG